MPDEDKRPPSTCDEKTLWEIEKLKAETNNLKRPYLKTPGSWITIMTVILALFGMTIQYYKSDREYQLAELKRQRTELETNKIEENRQQLLVSINEAELSLQELRSQREEVTNALNLLQSKANDLENRIVKTVSKEEASKVRQAVQDINQSVNNLTKINKQASNQYDRTTRNLNALSADLTARRSQLPAFAVVASYEKLEEAIAHARQLKDKKLSFPIEVYKGPNPTRYRISLGGYLTAEEAGKRVEYAKQQGIAQDAYVRFAQGWGENLFK